MEATTEVTKKQRPIDIASAQSLFDMLERLLKSSVLDDEASQADLLNFLSKPQSTITNKFFLPFVGYLASKDTRVVRVVKGVLALALLGNDKDVQELAPLLRAIIRNDVTHFNSPKNLSQLGAKEFSAVMFILKISTHLKSIDISSSPLEELSEGYLDLLYSTLKKLSNLEKLDISNTSFEFDVVAWTRFTLFILGLPNYFSLILKQCHLGRLAASQHDDLLVTSFKVAHLDLSSNQLNESSSEMPFHPTYMSLDLSNNMLASQAQDQWTQLLKKLKKVHKLHLGNNGLGLSGTTAFVALKKLEIHSLFLESNGLSSLSPEGWFQLGEMMEKGGVYELDLKDNDLGSMSEGSWAEFCSALKKMKYLRKLNLSSNILDNCTEASWLLFCNALQELTKLRQINFADNHFVSLSPLKWDRLRVAFDQFKKLKKLDFSKNFIGSRASFENFSAFSRVLSGLNIVELKLGENQFNNSDGDPLWRFLSNTLKSLPKLYSLSLAGNNLVALDPNDLPSTLGRLDLSSKTATLRLREFSTLIMKLPNLKELNLDETSIDFSTGLSERDRHELLNQLLMHASFKKLNLSSASINQLGMFHLGLLTNLTDDQLLVALILLKDQVKKLLKLRFHIFFEEIVRLVNVIARQITEVGQKLTKSETLDGCEDLKCTLWNSVLLPDMHGPADVVTEALLSFSSDHPFFITSRLEACAYNLNHSDNPRIKAIYQFITTYCIHNESFLSFNAGEKQYFIKMLAGALGVNEDDKFISFDYIVGLKFLFLVELKNATAVNSVSSFFKISNLNTAAMKLNYHLNGFNGDRFVSAAEYSKVETLFSVVKGVILDRPEYSTFQMVSRAIDKLDKEPQSAVTYQPPM